MRDKKQTGLVTASRSIPFLDSILSLAETLGVPKLFAWFALIAGPTAVSVWAFIVSALPMWALTLLSIAAFGVVAFALEKILSLAAGVKARLEVDREELAQEAERVARETRSLIAQHRPDIQKAWNEMPRGDDFVRGRGDYEVALGRLIEQYRYRHETDAWKVIHAVDYIVGLEKSDTWRIAHGVRSDNDLEEMATFLTQCAGWLRYGRKSKQMGT